VSSAWLMRLLGSSYLRQGRVLCAHDTLYGIALAAVKWCLNRDRAEVCTPNPMMPGMSKASMVAAEGARNFLTECALQSAARSDSALFYTCASSHSFQFQLFCTRGRAACRLLGCIPAPSSPSKPPPRRHCFPRGN
jgi:hypothetical protein